MCPNLSDHLTHSLSAHELLDPSLRAGVERSNPWALYCAWVVDWILAYTFVSLAYSSWMQFLGPLGLKHIPLGSETIFSNYGLYLKLALTPLIFAAGQFLALALHSKSFGMRLFKHEVAAPLLSSQLLYACGATVSLALLGLPVLNTWLDQLAGTQTTSEEYERWALHFVSVDVAAPINLLTELAPSDETTWKQAA
ncbi:MAG: hypothetical protein ACLGG7_04290 [Bacteriovoracia bacterium]